MGDWLSIIPGDIRGFRRREDDCKGFEQDVEYVSAMADRFYTREGAMRALSYASHQSTMCPRRRTAGPGVARVEHDITMM